MAVNFDLVTELQFLLRRDFPMADPDLVKPSNANPIMDGEFLNFDTSYKLVRAGSGEIGWAVFMEKGRFDVQALGKTMVLFAGAYEADTRVFKAAGLTLGGALAIDAAVSVDSLTKSGLAHLDTATYPTEVVMGRVTRLPANNGNLLRFFKTWA